jgi:hypothetical protein
MREYELLEDYAGKKKGDKIKLTSKNATGTSWTYKGSVVKLNINFAIKERLIKEFKEPVRPLFSSDEDKIYLGGQSYQIFPSQTYYVVRSTGLVHSPFQIIETKACTLKHGENVVGKFFSRVGATDYCTLQEAIKRSRLEIGDKKFNGRGNYFASLRPAMGWSNKNFSDSLNRASVVDFKIQLPSKDPIAIVKFSTLEVSSFYFKLSDFENKIFTFGNEEVTFTNYKLGIQGKYIDYKDVIKLYELIVGLRDYNQFGWDLKLADVVLYPKDILTDQYHISFGCLVGEIGELRLIVEEIKRKSKNKGISI